MSNMQFDIDEATIDNYRRHRHRHRWADIAAILGVHRATLERWRIRRQYVDVGVYIDDNEVDQHVTAFVGGNPGIGEVTIESHLVGVCGLRFTRQQLRASIRRCDPVGLAERRENFGEKIVRRIYIMSVGRTCCGTWTVCTN